MKYITAIVITLIIGAYVNVIMANFQPIYSDKELYEMLIQTEIASDQCKRKLERYKVYGNYTYETEGR